MSKRICIKRYFFGINGSCLFINRRWIIIWYKSDFFTSFYLGWQFFRHLKIHPRRPFGPLASWVPSNILVFLLISIFMCRYYSSLLNDYCTVMDDKTQKVSKDLKCMISRVRTTAGGSFQEPETTTTPVKKIEFFIVYEVISPWC